MALSRAEISKRQRLREKAGIPRLYRVGLTPAHLWKLADLRSFPDELLNDPAAVERELTEFLWEKLNDRYR
jgi:hypothetical protein